MRDPKPGLMALLASLLLLAGGAAVSAGVPGAGAPACEPAPARTVASLQAAPAFGWWTLYDDRRMTT